MDEYVAIASGTVETIADIFDVALCCTRSGSLPFPSLWMSLRRHQWQQRWTVQDKRPSERIFRQRKSWHRPCPIHVAGRASGTTPHLDGDSSLATEILPGPPSITSVQQAALKRDTKKPVSYLPPLDPNSTYSALLAVTPAASIPQMDGPRTKRMRAERGGASGRAQRATARHQNGQTAIAPIPSASNEGGSISALQAAPIDVDAAPISDDMPDTSASASAKASTSKPSNGRGRPRKDKGKVKEVSSTTVTVKEEPKTVVLNTPEPPLPMVRPVFPFSLTQTPAQSSKINNNEDHCFACRSTGALIYCDGCPELFISGVSTRQRRMWMKGIVNGIVLRARQSSAITHRYTSSRHGQLDERDQHRLRDRNGVPVLCFRCGTSALPESVAAAAPAAKRARRSSSINVSETWRPIVSCDYCSLHWHLDCLEPPLAIMPTFTKKWMCPNHAEQVIPLKRRIPKHNAPPIDITAPNQFNNGNIEVIQPETMPNDTQAKVAVDEVLINGRRYRVPERVIVLDFWNRINGTHGIQSQ
ncbi:clr6 histone deacetylase associated phd protein-2 cph [Salix suchowensis]|nr:clr6 histone deacetylase associated phd protein-2 cph [Salix suchowensis]